MVAASSQNRVSQSRRGRPRKLEGILEDCPEVYQRMLSLIRAGAFACGAAQALGIAPETFSRWMTRGRIELDGIYRQFRQDVLQAQAEARITAEIQVYRENPLAWLRFGPGRSRPDEPGWTDYSSDEEMPPSRTRKIALTQDQAVVESDNTLATALAMLEELGVVTLTPTGRELLIPSTERV